MTNSRVTRGRRTQKLVADWLRAHGWPRAKEVWGSEPGRDIRYVRGHAIEVKARSNFDPQAWWRQAKKNAKKGERPCVIVRMNGQGEGAVDDYLVFRRLADDELAQGM